MKRVSLADAPEEGVSHNPEIKKQTLLRGGDAPRLTNFARASLLPGQAARAHRHGDMSEVFFVERGSGVLRVEGVVQTLAPGVCVAVAPGEEHELINDGSEPLVIYYFGVEA
ncbi:MAG TPA: cupin domain-containing protein [Pyrinomonadaceae bacterium]|jgi:mannose-6-phosphate isomerase-like protein (cupin superfamily)